MVTGSDVLLKHKWRSDRQCHKKLVLLSGTRDRGMSPDQLD